MYVIFALICMSACVKPAISTIRPHGIFKSLESSQNKKQRLINTASFSWNNRQQDLKLSELVRGGGYVLKG